MHADSALSAGGACRGSAASAARRGRILRPGAAAAVKSRHRRGRAVTDSRLRLSVTVRSPPITGRGSPTRDAAVGTVPARCQATVSTAPAWGLGLPESAAAAADSDHAGRLKAPAGRAGPGPGARYRDRPTLQ